MLSSRALLLGSSLRRLANSAVAKRPIVNAVRNSHTVSYRAPPTNHSKATLIGAEVVGAAMWWWVLWHLWHEYEHITGEFYYPDPSEWTNAELGIPADNE